MQQLIKMLSSKGRAASALLLAVSLALIFASTSFFYHYVDGLNQKLHRDYESSARLLAHALTPVLNRPYSEKDVQALLAYLEGQDELVKAAVFNADNQLVSQYVGKGLDQQSLLSPYVLNGQLLWPKNRPKGVLFDSRFMHLNYRFPLQGQTSGSIYFQVHLNNNQAIQFRALMFVVGFLLLVAFLSFVASSWFRIVNLRPIETLSQIIKHIIEKKDFSLRAEKSKSDEIGLLFERFNTMMGDVERRDEALKFHKQRLEMEVEAQTNHLKASNAELELTVQALQETNRTLRVTEEDKRVAEKSAKTKATFLANMSHELRTPMNGVLGMINLLSETALTSEQMYYVRVALDSGSALLTILNDILDLSKIEHGKLSLENIEFDVHQIVDEVFSVLGESAFSKGVELVWHCKNVVPDYVIGDPVRIRQIIYNVVGNAIKFTESGYVDMGLGAEHFKDENIIMLTFRITDTGVGIKKEALPSIFDSFSQADSSTTRRYGGTGLGLALCKELTDLMGGDISVKSDFGKGSTFIFTVRVRPSNKKRVIPQISNKPKQVLILDDQTVSIVAVSQYLERLGINFEATTDTHQFLEKLRSQSPRYDLLVIDLSLPDANPRQLMETVREVPKYKHTPIILMGSHEQRSKTNVHYAAQTQGHWVKPFRFSVITHVLNRLGESQAFHVNEQALSSENPEGERSEQVDPRLERFEQDLDQLQTEPGTKGLLPREPQSEGDAQSSDKIQEQPRQVFKILVVEDNLVNQQVAVSRLKKLGYRVETADNGESAINKLKEQHYDLVFMDCQMPVLDGYEATRRIRQMDERASTLPIIAMTANAMSGDREKCLSAGMNDYLAKPVRTDELDKVLTNWLT